MPTLQAVVLYAFFVGFGLVVDVCVYTLSRFRDRSLTILNWTVPLVTYHLVLLTSVSLLVWLSHNSRYLQTGLGLVGSLLLMCVIYEGLCGSMGKKPFFSITDFVDTRLNGHKIKWLNPTALAVSWDAALGAVGIFAETGGYTNSQLGLALLVVGVTIAFFTLAAQGLAAWLRACKFHSVRSLTVTEIVGHWLQFCIFGSFAVSSGWHGLYAARLVTDPGRPTSIATSVAIISLLMLGNQKSIRQQARREAHAAIWGRPM